MGRLRIALGPYIFGPALSLFTFGLRLSTRCRTTAAFTPALVPQHPDRHAAHSIGRRRAVPDDNRCSFARRVNKPDHVQLAGASHRQHDRLG